MQKEFRWDPKQEPLIISIFETKGFRILKKAMNKVKKGQNKGYLDSTTCSRNLEPTLGFYKIPKE